MDASSSQKTSLEYGMSRVSLFVCLTVAALTHLLMSQNNQESPSPAPETATTQSESANAWEVAIAKRYQDENGPGTDAPLREEHHEDA